MKIVKLSFIEWAQAATHPSVDWWQQGLNLLSGRGISTVEDCTPDDQEVLGSNPISQYRSLKLVPDGDTALLISIKNAKVCCLGQTYVLVTIK